MSNGRSRRRFLQDVSKAGLTSLMFGSVGQAKDDHSTIIDCHLHINHFLRSTDDTIRHMTETGIQKAFFLPLETGEGGVTLSTDTVLEAYEKYPVRAIPFCQCDIRQANVLDRIRRYHKLGCRGIGEQKEHVPLYDPRLEKVIALCDELDWPITIHFQDGKNGFNQGIERHLEPLLKKYKRVRIIGHAQSFWSHISAKVPPPEVSLYPNGLVTPGGLIDRLMSDYPNLYGDLSAGSGFNSISRDKEFTKGFLVRHRKKLLFGSDCPCRDGKGTWPKGKRQCYALRLQKFLREMIDDEDVLEDILHRNAERALGGSA